MPLEDIFLHAALVPVNTNKCTKFQLPRLISFTDLQGS